MLSTHLTLDARKATALRTFDVMATGDLDDFAAVIHPEFFNHEQRDEPPATRGPHLQQVHGVAAWLRQAFGGPRWAVHETVAEGDLVVTYTTMSGRQTGPFVSYDREGHVASAFAATGRPFATTQSHWQRLRDGLVVEHWAQRDDLGTAEHLGWTAPTPLYLLRCALAKHRAKQLAGLPRRAEERRFGPWQGELDEGKDLALRAVGLMIGGPPEAFERLYRADARTRSLVGGPPPAGGSGPRVFQAAARWLTDGFADLDWNVHHVVAEGDLVAVHLTVSGRHVAPLAFFGEQGKLRAVYPPTGRRFAAQQTHWLRLAGDGCIAEHWVNRDDLGMAEQLGWIPPSPAYLARMAFARRAAVTPRA